MSNEELSFMSRWVELTRDGRIILSNIEIEDVSRCRKVWRYVEKVHDGKSTCAIPKSYGRREVK